MPPLLCFTPGLTLPFRHRTRIIDSKTTRCVAEKPVVVGKEKLDARQSFRVLDGTEGYVVPEPPVHRGIPLGGYLLEPLLGMNTPSKRAEKYGGIYSSDFFVLKKQVFINDYHAIVSCTRDGQIFRARDTFEPSENLFGSDALFMLDGDDHSALRSVLAPAFSAAVFPLYMQGISRLVRNLWCNAEDIVSKKGRVALDPLFREHYLSITIEITTGLPDSSAVARQLRDKINTAQTMMYSPPFGPLFNRAVRARNEILRILENLIRTTLVEQADTILRLRAYGDKLTSLGGREIGNGEVNVLLIMLASSDLPTSSPDTYSEDNAATIAKLARVLVVLWFAGYMTSAATTSCAAFEAGFSPEIWDALAKEQADILESRSDGDTYRYEPTYQEITSKMPLLDSYLTEVLRLHPPISGMHRKPVRDVEILGKLVKAGTTIYFELQPSMRNEELYENANTLVLDRFLKRPGVAQPPKILSFGAPGDIHHCLGASMSRMLMKSTLSTLLRDYTMEMDMRQSRKYNYIPEDSPSSKVIVRKLSKISQPTNSVQIGRRSVTQDDSNF